MVQFLGAWVKAKFALCFDAVHRYGAVRLVKKMKGGLLCFDAVHRYGAVNHESQTPAMSCVLMQFIVMVQ